ncbi:hypothetical protein TVAG_126310 [Trichomonas vaginalis G3]|uniref:Uncharacterized protein n=1 Tax=Trichomonas vaginalis (strain ATCC PRA-98 / G3) TaxID=412133 RepID=A2ED19_TRIV3|nr:hypothetical protein TVAGG3_0590680 [Trichomonas vaginalis G3]EAY09470.1 hypothetical protein TVAG_126310 [Trichomonas vaginalis G3]KAI5523230.1 hypothetical protein TVAGG3_0590680 [Trichomonas vaginalis G3]|eukprot:XP_001321693.1 hypothetical protein [Trichomonas vaginalis G3]
MLPLLAFRTAYNADDDNIGLPIPTKLGLLRIGIDRNSAEESDDDNWHLDFSKSDAFKHFAIDYHSNDEEDDDNWYVGLSYHSPWGKFSIGYHSNDEEDDENIRIWADLATKIGRFGFEYHNAAEEDDDNIHWTWGPVDFDLELNEDKKVRAKKPVRINKELLKRWIMKHGRRSFPRMYKKHALPKFAAKKLVTPKTNGWINPPWFENWARAYLPIFKYL